MVTKRNKSGMQLSSADWLEAHHDAKKEQRYDLAKRLAKRTPKSIIDLGCGTGLWLSIFNDIMPNDCKFIGVDLDEQSLEIAKNKAESWGRECEWIKLDVNNNLNELPSADLTLVFNFSSYIADLKEFFSYVSPENGFKEIALKQFAGDEIKFGPFTTNEHTNIDLSLKASIQGSTQIKYFDMDRLIEASSLTNRELVFRDFEIFSDFAPFKQNAWPYIKGTAEWTAERMPEREQKLIYKWIDNANDDGSLYFYSLDWFALLR